MRHLNLALKNKEKNPKSWQMLYETLVIQRIRMRYSVNQELAVLRQRESKPDEFAEYNAYVEECKNAVKEEMKI